MPSAWSFPLCRGSGSPIRCRSVARLTWSPYYAKLMSVLGYDRFGVHGGDIGSYIAHRLALDVPERIIGLHVTYPVEPPTVIEAERDDAEELRFLARRPADHERGGAYAHRGCPGSRGT